MFRELVNIAVAVTDIDEAIDRFGRAFGWVLDGQVQNRPGLMLRTARLRAGISEIELISPLPGEQVVQRFLTRHGEGVYRVAFEVDGMKEMLFRLDEEQIPFADITTAAGHEAHQIVVVHPKSVHGVMVELIERPRE